MSTVMNLSGFTSISHYDRSKFESIGYDASSIWHLPRFQQNAEIPVSFLILIIQLLLYSHSPEKTKIQAYF